MQLRVPLMIPAAALMTLAACSDSDQMMTTEPAAVLAPTGNRLATIGWEGPTPVLYLQNADGSDRARVHFEHVSNHVIGNYSPRQLPVTDETITRFTRMKWSPDGRYLAVIVAPAHEALQVVLVSADGRALRTVSPNSQYLWGDLDWSPDSRSIAYIMATGPFGQAPDIFVTELGRDVVKRVTTGGDLSGYDVVRFDASGQHLLFTKNLGWTDDGSNLRSQLHSIDLATGTIAPGAEVLGEPQGLARDGTWSLYMRSNPDAPGVRDLIRRAADGSEIVLTTGDLGGATVTEGDEQAVVTSWNKDGTQRFSVLGLTTPNDVRGELQTTLGTTWASLSQPLP